MKLNAAEMLAIGGIYDDDEVGAEDDDEVGADEDDEVGADEDDEVGADEDDEVGGDDDDEVGGDDDGALVVIGGDDDDDLAIGGKRKKGKNMRRKGGGKVVRVRSAADLQLALNNAADKKHARRSIEKQQAPETTLAINAPNVGIGAYMVPAGGTATIYLTPPTAFTPKKVWCDPIIAANFELLNVGVGKVSQLGSSDPQLMTTYSGANPTPVDWASFDATQPMLVQVHNLDAVNAQKFSATLYGTSRPTKSI